MNFWIFEIAVKISAVMALAAVVAGLMRRRASAASRHLLWTLAVIGVLVLPAVTLTLPRWSIPVTPVPSAGPATEITIANLSDSESSATLANAKTLADAPNPANQSSLGNLLNFVNLLNPLNLAVLYVAGVVLLLGRLVVEQCKTRRLLSRTTAIEGAEWTALLRECTARLGITRPVRLVGSREQTMPMTMGIWQPAIVIPSVAGMWDDDRRRAVLLHELAHVVRFDCLTQWLAEIAVAIYWPHPGTWLMARQLRVERELACDDCVIASGTEPRAYAGHLLEIAHSLGGCQASALVVSMARPRQLEGRMLAMLDATRSRATPAPGRRFAAFGLAAAVVAPLAAVTPVAVPASARASATGQRVTSTPVPERVASSLMPGTWQLRISADGRNAQLTVSLSEHSSHSMTIPVDRIEGLAAILSGPGGAVRYSLKRDAGTFDFEGTLRSGAGGGTFTFAPSATFPAELAKRGFAKPTLAEQQALAGADIGFAFIGELAEQKYARPSLEQLVNAAMHGVTRNYVREMSALGYRPGTVDALIRLRDHGVDSRFIRDLQAEGLTGLAADDFVRARDHGVDPDYVRGLRALGYGPLTLGELVNARDHGIDPQYARGLRELGYSGLSLNDLIAARGHGVSTDYVKELRQLGYQPALTELISGRGHGVDAAYAKAIISAGYERPTLPELIRLRDHGVTPEYARSAQKGGSRPSIDRLIELHDRGPNAEAGPDRGNHPHRSASVFDHVHRVIHDFYLRMFKS